MTGDVEVADDALAKQVEDMKITGQGDGAKMEKRTGKGTPRKGRSYEERLKEWEEKQKDKKILERGCKGTVKWYSVSGRYGFISRNIEGLDDIFVHQSAITKSTAEKFWHRSLADNQDVEFDILEGEKGLEAGNVTGPDGEPVKSSPYRRYYNNPHRGTKNGGRRRDNETPKKEGEETDGKDEGGEEKPRRRRFKPRTRKNKPDGEKDGEEKPKRQRHRRPKSESKPDAKEGGEEAAPTAEAKE